MEIAFFTQHMMVLGDFFLNGWREEYPDCKFPAFKSGKKVRKAGGKGPCESWTIFFEVSYDPEVSFGDLIPDPTTHSDIIAEVRRLSRTVPHTLSRSPAAAHRHAPPHLRESLWYIPMNHMITRPRHVASAKANKVARTLGSRSGMIWQQSVSVKQLARNNKRVTRLLRLSPHRTSFF